MTMPFDMNTAHVDNTAKLRDLIVATCLVIIIKLDSNRRFLQPVRPGNLMDDLEK